MFLGGRLLGSLGISRLKEGMTEVFPAGLGAGAREGTRTCVSLKDPPSSHVLVSVQATLSWRNCISSQRASVASYSYRCSYLTDSCPDEGGGKFLRNVDSYKSHTA
jgi:hypothetical protein